MAAATATRLRWRSLCVALALALMACLLSTDAHAAALTHETAMAAAALPVVTASSVSVDMVSPASNASTEAEGRSELGDELHEGDEEAEEEETRKDAIVAVATITCLITISILFEMFTEFLRETTDEMNMPFINTVFSELTTLGFIGLLLFVVTKLDVLSRVSLAYLGEREKLQETIEMLHMGLFLFIVIFLVLCCALLQLGVYAQNEWRDFERGSSDVASTLCGYVLLTEPPRSWRERFSLSRILAARKARREVTYMSLRRRFMDFRSNHPNPETARRFAKEFQRKPDLRFPFNEYLSIISGEVMGRLIEIDLSTWVALEVVLVVALVLCWKLGPHGEIWFLLGSGLLLIAMNELVHKRIEHMRRLLTPPRLLKDAERMRHKNEWRARNGLELYDLNEKTRILKTARTSEDDFTPPYINTLPGGGLHMSKAELAQRQKMLLRGKGNGVRLALFSSRLVLLLTAMHLAMFLVRTASQIYALYPNWLHVLALYALFLLPSILVPLVSLRIARDGLYAFNVEHMKATRVIAKVMRILKARQTLRMLRFVAEMKIYLNENVRRSLQLAVPIASTPTSDAGDVSPALSPIAMYMATRDTRTDANKLEAERRDINSIFCLFDTDGSGSISRDEMRSLLIAITHELDEAQLDRLMSDLVEGDDDQEVITFEVFCKWCHRHIHESDHSKEELIEEIFHMVDTDGSGFITVDEFIAIFKTLGQSLDHDDVRELIYRNDRNDDGKFDLEEFAKMLEKHEV